MGPITAPAIQAIDECCAELTEGVAELDAVPTGTAELNEGLGVVEDRLRVVEEAATEDAGPNRNAESTTNCCL